MRWRFSAADRPKQTLLSGKTGEHQEEFKSLSSLASFRDLFPHAFRFPDR